MSTHNIPREQLWVTSKLWNSFHEPTDVKPALQQSLNELGLAYLDLYLIHWPISFVKSVMMPSGYGDFIPPDKRLYLKAWQEMEKCVKEGLIKNIGVSNFAQHHLDELFKYCTIKPVVNQCEMHPYLQQVELLNYCTKHGIHMTAYSPLGSKDRTISQKASDEPDLFTNPVIKAISKKHGATPAQVLIQWAIARGTSVIPKSSNLQRITENFEALQLALDREDLENIKQLERSYRFLSASIFFADHSPYTSTYLWG